MNMLLLGVDSLLDAAKILFLDTAPNDFTLTLVAMMVVAIGYWWWGTGGDVIARKLLIRHGVSWLLPGWLTLFSLLVIFGYILGGSSGSTRFWVWYLVVSSIGSLIGIFLLRLVVRINTVNINDLEVHELAALPYIDTETAHKILSYRCQNGCISSMEEFRKVTDMPTFITERLQSQIRFYPLAIEKIFTRVNEKNIYTKKVDIPIDAHASPSAAPQIQIHSAIEISNVQNNSNKLEEHLVLEQMDSIDNQKEALSVHNIRSKKSKKKQKQKLRNAAAEHPNIQLNQRKDLKGVYHYSTRVAKHNSLKDMERQQEHASTSKKEEEGVRGK